MLLAELEFSSGDFATGVPPASFTSTATIFDTFFVLFFGFFNNKITVTVRFWDSRPHQLTNGYLTLSDDPVVAPVVAAASLRSFSFPSLLHFLLPFPQQQQAKTAAATTKRCGNAEAKCEANYVCNATTMDELWMKGLNEE